MAKKTAEPNDSDRIAGFAHPRETTVLLGQDIALARAARALRAGRPPSGWLITGPPGVGKATLAYRIARYLLAYGATADGSEDLSVPQDDTAARQVAAQSHPGLMVLKRTVNLKTGKLRTELVVDEVRRLADFFGMTSGAGGWRVAIIDTADDMNDNAANALLKMLEEPPANALLLLLSNTPGRLLPTIRSRCRLLAFRPLPPLIVERILAELPEPPVDDVIKAAAARSEGSLTRAMTFVDPDLLAIVRHVEMTLARLPEFDRGELLAMAETLASRDKTLEFETVLQTIESWILANCHQHLNAGASRLAPLTEVWEKTARNARDTERFNLDRRPFLLTLFTDLAEAVRLSYAA